MTQKGLNDNKNNFSKCRIYLTYSALFFVVLLLVFIWFPLNGKTLVWGIDGFEQHYKSYVFFGEYLRSVFKNIFINHTLSIPEFSFCIGEGADILQTLHYYCIGDPFAFFSFIFPSEYCYIYYQFAIILRLYLAGVFFLSVCIYLNNTNKYALLTGVFIYVFSYWSLLNAARHPFFLAPLVYFPLIILGIEMIIREKKALVFIFAVFISAISNFYFFYMIVLTTVIYVGVRLISIYKTDIKAMLMPLLRIFLSSVLGVMLAAVIVLPMIFTFLGDSRMSVDNSIQLVYPFSYYTKIIGLFVAEGDTYWTCMGYAVTALLSIVVLFLDRKRHTILKVLFVICVVFITIPAFGQLFNGLSYVSNRWIWSFAFLNAYIVTVEFDNLCNISGMKQKLLTTVLILYFFVCVLFSYSRNLKTLIPLIIGIALSMLINTKIKKYKHVILLAATLCCIVLNAMFKYASFYDDYTSECVSADDVNKLLPEELVLLREYISVTYGRDELSVTDRYTGFGLSYNSNILQGVSATGLYWTITNPFVDKARVENGLVMESVLPHKFEGYDSRTVLTELSSNRYLIYNKNALYNPMDKGEYEIRLDRTDNNLPVPRGYERVSENDNFIIYENKNALPIAYSYDKCISYSDWLKLPLYDREHIMLDTVVLDDDVSDKLPVNNLYTSAAIKQNYTEELSSYGIVKNDNSYVVTTPGASVKFTFSGKENYENYLLINNMSFKGVSKYQLYHGDEAFDPSDEYSQSDWDKVLTFKERKKIFTDFLYWRVSTSKVKITLETSNGLIKDFRYFTPSYSFYNGADDFLVNIGECENGLNSVTIYFPKAGIYSFEDLRLVSMPMNDYEEKVEDLAYETINDIELSEDEIRGSVSLSTDKLLVLSIPYSKGWTAYVDGEETEIVTANLQYIGLSLSEGNHEIYFKYNTPYLREGAIISLVGIFIFVFYIIMRSRSRYGMN